MDKSGLYMVAIVPPDDLKKRIEVIRNEFAEAYDCKAALKPPVHITLYPPWQESASEEGELKKLMGQFAKTQSSFDLEVKGFDAFIKNGVIFINVLKNERLKELHKQFTTLMTKYLQPEIRSKQDFHPHFTIGYRDIPKHLFPDAVKDYLPRKFDASFKVKEIFFWRHNGSRWETIASFALMKEGGEESQASLF